MMQMREEDSMKALHVSLMGQLVEEAGSAVRELGIGQHNDQGSECLLPTIATLTLNLLEQNQWKKEVAEAVA